MVSDMASPKARHESIFKGGPACARPSVGAAPSLGVWHSEITSPRETQTSFGATDGHFG
jgi:hypothetical protein